MHWRVFKEYLAYRRISEGLYIYKILNEKWSDFKGESLEDFKFQKTIQEILYSSEFFYDFLEDRFKNSIEKMQTSNEIVFESQTNEIGPFFI